MFKAKQLTSNWYVLIAASAGKEMNHRKPKRRKLGFFMLKCFFQLEKLES